MDQMAQSTEGLDLRSEQSRGYLLRLEWDAMGEAGEVMVVVMCACVCVYITGVGGSYAI